MCTLLVGSTDCKDSVNADLSSDQQGTTTFSVQWGLGLNAEHGSVGMTHIMLWALSAL